MSLYTNNIVMQELTKAAEELKTNVFSDVVDEEGNQYVDLVQEGGGVLGIALVGYTYILEKAGIRFYSLAGTSAGSINTLLIASMGKIGEPVSEKILNVLANQNLFDFVDGPRSIKKLIQKKIDGEKGVFLSLFLNGMTIYRTLARHLGINPGITFQDWLTKVIQQEGIYTNKDLSERRSQLPLLYNRNTREKITPEAKLALVTSEVSTHTKVDFPRMASLYWKEVDGINPAEFARASMSIPYFFYPFELSNIPNAGKEAGADWQTFASYYGVIPPVVRFVDGGMLSNFPIGIFHRRDGGIPSRPTFGARLSTYRDNYSETAKLTQLSGAMISTMRQIFDYDFILKHPDYKKLICNIDADADFNWLNFNMSEERKVALFQLGAKKALAFLQNFKWDQYKEIRAKLSTMSH